MTAALLVAALIALLPVAPAMASSTALSRSSAPASLETRHPHPQPDQPQVPPDAKTPGQRDPLVGALAAVGIIVTLAAGIYVYRIIRKGL